MIRVLLALGACLLAASLALAENMTLTLKDGTKITGDVTKTDQGFLVKTKYGDVICPEDRVASAAPAVDYAKEYKQRLDKIDPKDVDARIDLAQWAIDNSQYDIAQTELSAAMRLDPSNAKAKLLQRQIKSKITPSKEPPVKPPPLPPEKGDTGTPTTAPKGNQEFVSDEDMYKMRLYELRDGENVKIDYRDTRTSKVIDRFVDQMAGTGDFKDRDFETYFRNWNRVRQVRYMLRETDPDDPIRNDILIKTDPKFMIEFRNNVWPTIAGSCAQLKCHGAPKGQGEFKLYNLPARGEKMDYTNFLIMSLWEKDGKKIIDRGHNDLSLLLQYGLTPAQAQYVHPREIPQIFLDIRSPAYRRFDKWISSLSDSKKPAYRCTYQPPVGRKLSEGEEDLLHSGSQPAQTQPSPSDKKD